MIIVIKSFDELRQLVNLINQDKDTVIKEASDELKTSNKRLEDAIKNSGIDMEKK